MYSEIPLSRAHPLLASRLNRLRDLQDMCGGIVDGRRQALQGEGVIARASDRDAENYLFSVNAQTCVIATFHDAENRTGAVIHIDSNVPDLIESAYRRALVAMSAANDAAALRLTLTGGGWGISDGTIARTAHHAALRMGLAPHWTKGRSWFEAFGGSYGIRLDLDTGVTYAFRHGDDVALQALKHARADAPHRFAAFTERFRRPPVFDCNYCPERDDIVFTRV